MRQCICLVTVLVALAALVAAVPKEIRPTDADWLPKIKGLTAGDTLTVHAGTYTLSSKFATTWAGTAQSPIVIQAASGEARPVFKQTSGQNIWDINGQYFTVKGIDFTGGGRGVRCGEASDVKHVIFDDIHIHHLSGNAFNANDVGRTYDNITVRYSQFGYTAGSGECVYAGCNYNGCHIKNSVFEFNYCYETLAATSGSQGSGYQIKTGSSNNIIRHNVCKNTKGVCVLVYDDYDLGPNIVEGNVAINVAADNGIQATAGAIIRNNIVISASGAGIQVSNNQPRPGKTPRNVIIRHNTVYGPSKRCVYLTGGNVTANLVVANNALYCANGNAVYLNGVNSTMWTAVNNGYLGVLPAGSGSGNFLLSTTVSAVFANAAGNNFYPAVSSALIDAGSVAHTAAIDFNGLVRTNPPTVGAYEFSSNTNPGWQVTGAIKQLASGSSPLAVVNPPAIVTTPTAAPTAAPKAVPVAVPTAVPRAAPVAAPTAVPTAAPRAVPVAVPTAVPRAVPVAAPTAAPTSTSAPVAAPTSVGSPTVSETPTQSNAPVIGSPVASNPTTPTNAIVTDVSASNTRSVSVVVALLALIAVFLF